MQLNDRQQTAANILWLAAGKPQWRNLYKHAIAEADAETVAAILERGTGHVTAEQADAFIRTRDPVEAGFVAVAEAAPEQPAEDKPVEAGFVAVAEAAPEQPAEDKPAEEPAPKRKRKTKKE